MTHMNQKFHRYHSLWSKLIPLLGVIVFMGASWIVYHEVRSYHWWQIKTAIQAIPVSVLGLAFLSSLVGYGVLAHFDWLGVRYTNKHLPYHKALFTGALAYALSNNIGYAPISGGSLRYRFYTSWDLPVTAVAKIIGFCLLTYILGFGTLIALVPFFSIKLDMININAVTFGFIHYGSLVCIIGWLILLAFYRKPILFKHSSIQLPAFSLGSAQIALGVLDLVMASLVLFVPFHHYIAMDYQTFLVIFLLAQVMGLISQVPGGIGVFEGGFLFLTANHIDSSHVFAALIIFRCFYFFVPLLIAVIVLVIYEMRMLYKRRRYKYAIIVDKK